MGECADRVHQKCVVLEDGLLTALDQLCEQLVMSGHITRAASEESYSEIMVGGINMKGKRCQVVRFLLHYYMKNNVNTKSTDCQSSLNNGTREHLVESCSVESDHLSTTLGSVSTRSKSKRQKWKSTLQKVPPNTVPVDNNVDLNEKYRSGNDNEQKESVINGGVTLTESSSGVNISGVCPIQKSLSGVNKLNDSGVNPSQETRSSAGFDVTSVCPSQESSAGANHSGVNPDTKYVIGGNSGDICDDEDNVEDDSMESDDKLTTLDLGCLYEVKNESNVETVTQQADTLLKLSFKKQKKTKIKPGTGKKMPRQKCGSGVDKKSNVKKENCGEKKDVWTPVVEDDEMHYTHLDETEVSLDTKSHQVFFRIRDKKPLRFQCRVCPYQTPRKDGMVQHVRKHTGERPYKCLICGKSYNTSIHLTRHHSASHRDQSKKQVLPRRKNFRCDQCDKAYDCRYKLTEHSHLHTGAKPNECEHCDFKTRRRKSLLEHMVAKHGSGPRQQHACDRCDKFYLSRYSLKLHQALVHNPEKKSFVCEICGKNFKTWPLLKEHYLCHDDKVFKCQHCKFKTNRPKYFRLHEANHEMKTRQCEICGKGLSSLAALQNHLKVIHGPNAEEEKSYSCKVCGVQYNNKQSMNSHMRKHKSKTQQNTDNSVSPTEQPDTENTEGSPEQQNTDNTPAKEETEPDATSDELASKLSVIKAIQDQTGLNLHQNSSNQDNNHVMLMNFLRSSPGSSSVYTHDTVSLQSLQPLTSLMYEQQLQDRIRELQDKMNIADTDGSIVQGQ